MKVSFIIPCYNVAETLPDSVFSVIMQNLEDYEIIIVNDGSLDATLNVAQELAAKTPQIVVLDKPNGGVSSARNVGIKKATGDYLVFLDADDVFDVNLWKEVKPFAQQSQKLIIFGFDTEETPTRIQRYSNTIKHDLLSDYLMGRVHIHICSFFVKREIVLENNILFNESTHFSEDIEFIVRLLLLSKDYVYIHKSLFHYKYRESSAMHVPIYNERKSTSLDAMARILGIVGDNEERHNAALTHLKLTIILHVKRYFKTNCKDQNLWNKLFNYCSNYLCLRLPLSLNKYSIYVWTMSLLYKLNIKLFFKIVRVL